MALVITGSTARVNQGLTTNFAQTTWSFWIRKDGVGSGNNYLFNKSTNANSIRLQAFFQLNQDWTTTDGQWNATGFSPVLGTLYHMVVTYDGSLTSNVPKFYVDGVLLATSTITTPVGTRTGTGSHTFFNNAGGTQGWQLAIEDLRIYSRILSDEEVTQVYNARGLDGIINNLELRWCFDAKTSGATTVVNDHSLNRRNGSIVGATLTDATSPFGLKFMQEVA